MSNEQNKQFPLFATTLDLLYKCISLAKVADDDLSLEEMHAREDLADKCQLFLNEYYNR